MIISFSHGGLCMRCEDSLILEFSRAILFAILPSVKFVLAIIDSIYNKKKGVIFFRKIGHDGGGGGIPM